MTATAVPMILRLRWARRPSMSFMNRLSRSAPTTFPPSTRGKLI